MIKKPITQEYLKEVIQYCPTTGEFTWLISTSNCVKAGSLCGFTDKEGYRLIHVGGHTYRSHRLAILYMTGSMPTGVVDHINGVVSDNRFSNLRPCTHAENLRNRSATKKNKSGAKGVHWDKTSSKWMVICTTNQKKKMLGRFSDLNAAVDAYNSYAKLVHGEFFRPSVVPA